MNHILYIVDERLLPFILKESVRGHHVSPCLSSFSGLVF